MVHDDGQFEGLLGSVNISVYQILELELLTVQLLTVGNREVGNREVSDHGYLLTKLSLKVAI